MASPKPKKESSKDMTFTEALAEILTGKTVTKKEWDDHRYYILLSDERLRLHKPDGKEYDWILSEADLRGDDYVLL